MKRSMKFYIIMKIATFDKDFLGRSEVEVGVGESTARLGRGSRAIG